MFEIFDETNLRQTLAPYIPPGETLLAGIHAITLRVDRKRFARSDVYLGLTATSLLVDECIERKYLTRFYGNDGDFCVRLPLSEIRRCTCKPSTLGSIRCELTMTDGSFLSLVLPKLGGPGRGMPHHAEYRAKIVERLRALGRA